MPRRRNVRTEARVLHRLEGQPTVGQTDGAEEILVQRRMEGRPSGLCSYWPQGIQPRVDV